MAVHHAARRSFPCFSRLNSTSLCFFSGITMCTYFFFIIFCNSENFDNTTGEKILTYADDNMSCRDDPLMYIPQNTVRVWDERNFLVVFGIPSLDIPKRRWRRHMQRTSCWQFPEVARRHNNYAGAMLVLYLLARHPLNKFLLSEEVVREAKEWHDIVIHPMNEGLSNTDKMVVGYGKWGVEAEIGSSRKTFFWFQFALQRFPGVPYVAKGDDDMFLRVPQYLMDLRRLPLRRVYWGRYTVEKENVNKRRRRKVKYMSGYCFTLSIDVSEQLVSYEPLRKLVWTPYSKPVEFDFLFLSMKHEDVMVGRVLSLTGYPVIFFAETEGRFSWDLNPMYFDVGVAVHRLKEHEYYYFMSHFLSNVTTPTRTVMIKRSPFLVFFKPLFGKKMLPNVLSSSSG